ncbi:helix-turn-helix domain-containing protein [Kribbella sp. VKM Ac-2568]|uniref:helix-turn-helix domain-containing protein n=1 Tax=Kribbella sp. VKM Ac-2568 TaxID=2512219 RepID=UPI0010434137|nr:helix-turn-helix domain-containing protein [Kribbella sp. VKM Ac-2568]TCM49028.1 AraC family L-rhamnose operon transcriptional activator RhaR [Kribbella sp. VKM Ac-2568]
MPETLHEHALFDGRPVFGGIHELSADVAAHTHDFVEIAVVGPGRGRHLTSRGERRLRHGEVIVLRPGAWHSFTGCVELTVANCCISTQALRAEFAALRDIPMFRRLLWTDPVAAGAHGVHVASVGAAAATEAIAAITDLNLTGRTPGRVLGRLVTVLGVLADARDAHERRSRSGERGSGPGRSAGGAHGSAGGEAFVHPAVTDCIARIEAEPAQPWRLDELAKAVSLDPAYLGRLFRRSVGLSPLDFLARVRSEHAAALLTRTQLPVARVGATVGWPDPTYFARRFRTLSGLTPSEYRRRSVESSVGSPAHGPHRNTRDDRHPVGPGDPLRPADPADLGG